MNDMDDGSDIRLRLRIEPIEVKNMATNEKMPEIEIAELAKVFFKHSGYKMYPEVVLDGFNGRPDYVCTKGKTLVHVMECKQSFTWGVFEQLYQWVREARMTRPHLITAVVGDVSLSSGMQVRLEMMKANRFGLLSINKRPNQHERIGFSKNGEYWHSNAIYTFNWILEPKIISGSRKTAHLIRNQLNDDMMIATAGARGGETEYMTPFKRTMARVSQVLATSSKELHITHILEGVNRLGGHHYTSDKSFIQSVPTFIRKFELGEEAKRSGPWFVGANRAEQYDNG